MTDLEAITEARAAQLKVLFAVICRDLAAGATNAEEIFAAGVALIDRAEAIARATIKAREAAQ